MSHYTVAVITEDGDYESALAPFSEHLDVEPYITETRQEIIDTLREQLNSEHPEEWTSRYDYTNDDTLIQSYIKRHDDYDFDENGNRLSTYNPKSKWDYYREIYSSVRYKGIDEDDAPYQVQVKNIDFSPMPMSEEDYNYHKRFWEINVEGDSLREDENKFNFMTFRGPEYYKEVYGTFENFVNRFSRFIPYAVLYHGEWIAPGDVGWFGSDTSDGESNRQYQKRVIELFENLNPEDWFVVVDCHI